MASPKMPYARLCFTAIYGILAVVFRWFVGVLISKIFFISIFGHEEAQETPLFEGYLKVLFLESWTFYEIIIALVIVSVCMSFLQGLRTYLTQLIVMEDSTRLRARLFEAMLDYERNSSGLQDTMLQKLELVQQYRLTQEDCRVMDTVIFCASVVLLVVFSWKSFLLVLGIVVTQKVWVATFDIPVLSKLRKEFQEKQAKVVSHMMDAARVRDLVQISDRQAEEANAVSELEAISLQVNNSIAKRAFIMQFVPQTINILTMPAVCIMSYELMKGLDSSAKINEGVSLLLVMFTLQELHRALSELIVIEEAKIVHDAAKADIDQFLAAREEALDEAAEQKSSGSASSVEGNLVMSQGAEESILSHNLIPSMATPLEPGGAPSLSLVDVSFQYRGAAKSALTNANAAFDGGMIHAVMGESGGGKSTVLKLFSGLLQPTKGSVLVDGQPLGSMLGKYRAMLGVVSQDSLLFARTVRENLCYGLSDDDPRCSEEKVQEALRMACMDGVVAGLEKGVDTMLTNGETQLSGGQRQRLHLARLFVRNPQVVLMDEPTSALDSVTMAKVVTHLESFLQGKTAVIVSHHREAVVDRLCAVVHHVEVMSGLAPAAGKKRPPHLSHRGSFVNREHTPRHFARAVSAAPFRSVSAVGSIPEIPTAALPHSTGGQAGTKAPG